MDLWDWRMATPNLVIKSNYKDAALMSVSGNTVFSWHGDIDDEDDISFVSEWDLRMNRPLFGGAPLSDGICKGSAVPQRAIGAECGAPLQLHFDDNKLVVRHHGCNGVDGCV